LPKSPVVESLGGRLKQSLTALKAGQESLGQFAEGLFSDFAKLHLQVQEAEKNLFRQRQLLEQERQEFEALQAQREANRSELELRLQTQLEEIEKDRRALEEELAIVRAEAANMAATIADQKQQLTDEHAEWADELKQLRRILDKQATWIAGQAEVPVAALPNPRPSARTPAEPGASGGTSNPPGAATTVRAASSRSRIIPAGVGGSAAGEATIAAT
jgi:hypothetical protein